MTSYRILLQRPMNVSFSDLNKKHRKFVKQFSATKSNALPCLLREYVTDDGKGPRLVPKAAKTSSLAEKAAAAKAKAKAKAAADAEDSAAVAATAAADQQGAAAGGDAWGGGSGSGSSRSPSFGKFHQSSLASFGSLRKQHSKDGGSGGGGGGGGGPNTARSPLRDPATGMLSKSAKMGSSVLILSGLDDDRTESQADEDGLPFSPTVNLNLNVNLGHGLDEDGLPSASPVPSSLPSTPQNTAGAGAGAGSVAGSGAGARPTMLKEATSARTQLALNALKELDAESTENGEAFQNEQATVPAPTPAADEKKKPARRKLVRGGNKHVTPVLPEFTNALSALDDLDGFLNKYEEMNSEILNFDGPNVKDGQPGTESGDGRAAGAAASAADAKTSFFSRMTGNAKGGADFTMEGASVPAAAAVGKSAYGQMFDTLF